MGTFEKVKAIIIDTLNFEGEDIRPESDFFKDLQADSLDVVELMEGPVNILDCLTAAPQCARANHCAARQIWGGVNQKIIAALAGVTLQQVIDVSASDGTADAELPEYCI